MREIELTGAKQRIAAAVEEVLFIDDRAENTAAARELGMRAMTFTSAGALDRDLLALGGPGSRS